MRPANEPLPRRQCSKCGAVLTLKTLRGLCPSCLALVALDLDTSETVANSSAGPDEARESLSSSVRYFGDESRG